MERLKSHEYTDTKKKYFIYKTKGILSDIYILRRQVQNYANSERIDLLGVDNDNNIVIIEIKDEQVDEKVIPQVMRYAFWVETNPDSIKNLWLEHTDRPEDLEFDWSEKLNIRILIIAPFFNSSVQKLVSKVKYQIELIEFKKFKDEDADYIFLNNLEIEEPKTSGVTISKREHGLEFYESERNPNSAKIFWNVANKMEEYLKGKNWNLTRSNNRSYISFKYGFPVVCGIRWLGTKSMALFLKVTKEKAQSISIKNFPLLEYREQWNEANYKVDSTNIDLSEFSPLFDAAYKYISGE